MEIDNENVYFHFADKHMVKSAFPLIANSVLIMTRLKGKVFKKKKVL